jgi:hypothetical protein
MKEMPIICQIPAQILKWLNVRINPGTAYLQTSCYYYYIILLFSPLLVSFFNFIHILSIPANNRIASEGTQIRLSIWPLFGNSLTSLAHVVTKTGFSQCFYNVTWTSWLQLVGSGPGI